MSEFTDDIEGYHDFAKMPSLDPIAGNLHSKAQRARLEKTTPAKADFSDKWQTGKTRLKFCNVPWDTEYHNTVDWDTEARRNTWFDDLKGDVVQLDTSWNYKSLEIYKPALGKYEGTIRTHIPYETAMGYNYLYVVMYDVPTNTYTQKRDHFFYHITGINPVAPNTTELTLELDAWTEYILSAKINAVNLERGHWAHTQMPADQWLKNPLASPIQMGETEPDLPSVSNNVSKVEFFPIYDDSPVYIVACTGDLSDPGSFWKGGKVPDPLKPWWWYDPSNLDPKTDKYVDLRKTETRTYKPYPISTDVTTVGAQTITDNTKDDNIVPISPVAPANGSNLQNPTNIRHFAMAAADWFKLINTISEKWPQVLNCLKCAFILPSRFVELGKQFTFEGIPMQPVKPNPKWVSLGSMGINTDTFGYPQDAKDFAKLYNHQFAAIDISDNNGQGTTLSCEELSGDLEAYARANSVYSFLKLEAFIDGFGGKGIQSYTVKPVTPMKAQLPKGLWENTKVEWEIPTYAIYAEASTDAISQYAKWHYEFDEINKMHQRARYEADLAMANASNTNNKAHASGNAGADCALTTGSKSNDLTRDNGNDSAAMARDNGNASAKMAKDNGDDSAGLSRDNSTESAHLARDNGGRSNDNAKANAYKSADNAKTNGDAENETTLRNADDSADMAHQNAYDSAEGALTNAHTSANNAKRNSDAENDTAWENAGRSADVDASNSHASSDQTYENTKASVKTRSEVGQQNIQFVYDSSTWALDYARKMQTLAHNILVDNYQMQSTWLAHRNEVKHGMASFGVAASSGAQLIGESVQLYMANHTDNNDQSRTGTSHAGVSPQNSSVGMEPSMTMKSAADVVAPGITPAGDAAGVAVGYVQIGLQEAYVNMQMGLQNDYDQETINWALTQADTQFSASYNMTTEYNGTQNTNTKTNSDQVLDKEITTANNNNEGTHSTTSKVIDATKQMRHDNADADHTMRANVNTNNLNTANTVAQKTHDVAEGNADRTQKTTKDNAKRSHDTQATVLANNKATAEKIADNNWNTEDANLTNTLTKTLEIITRTYKVTEGNIKRTYDTTTANIKNTYNVTTNNIKRTHQITLENLQQENRLALSNVAMDWDVGKVNINNDYLFAVYKAEQDWVLGHERIQSEIDAMRSGKPVQITENSGEGEQDQWGMHGITVRVRRVNDADAEQIAHTFIRYGYRMSDNTWINNPKLSLMSEYTYWQCRDVMLDGTQMSETAREFLRHILMDGTTVWRDPNKVQTDALHNVRSV